MIVIINILFRVTYLFKTVVDKCTNGNLIFSAETIIVDLETAIHNAVPKVKPETNIDKIQ